MNNQCNFDELYRIYEKNLRDRRKVPLHLVIHIINNLKEGEVIEKYAIEKYNEYHGYKNTIESYNGGNGYKKS